MQELKPCPSSPNCVCSKYPEDVSHFIDPLSFPTKELAQKAFNDLPEILPKHFRTKEVRRERDFLHLVFSTKLMRFKDDVVFVLDDNLVHVRSASRLGRSDFGKNRKRIEEIRAILKQAAF